MKAHSIYVAAKFEDRLLVREVFKTIESYGFRVALDWTDHEKDGTLDKIKWANADIDAIRECDAVIALFIEERHQRGALIEIGAALGLNKPVIIVGDKENTSTLLRHPLITRVNNQFEALELLSVLPVLSHGDKGQSC